MPKIKPNITKRGKEMKTKMRDYLTWKIEQHKTNSESYFQRYMKAQKIQMKNRHYVDYKRHQEAQTALEKTLFVLTTIDQMEQEMSK